MCGFATRPVQGWAVFTKGAFSPSGERRDRGESLIRGGLRPGGQLHRQPPVPGGGPGVLAHPGGRAAAVGQEGEGKGVPQAGDLLCVPEDPGGGVHRLPVLPCRGPSGGFLLPEGEDPAAVSAGAGFAGRQRAQAAAGVPALLGGSGRGGVAQPGAGGTAGRGASAALPLQGEAPAGAAAADRLRLRGGPSGPGGLSGAGSHPAAGQRESAVPLPGGGVLRLCVRL